jgi:hypothetical protein
MSQIKFESTTSELISENYPYGYTLRTTKTDWLEFNPRKGFRHVSQTINPKNGKPNAEKKGRYLPIQLLGRDTAGHVKGWATRLNGADEWQKALPFLADNFALFTTEQLRGIYVHWLAMSKVTMYSLVTYRNSDLEKLKILFEPAVNLAVRGANSCDPKNSPMPENLFGEINKALDYAAIEATEDKDYKPFKTVVSFPISSVWK